MASTDLVTTITAAGLLAATRNPPNRNGFRVELGRAIAYDGSGVAKGTFPTNGYVLSDGTVRVAVMIGENDVTSSFDLYRVDLIDVISNIVFCRLHREDNSVIDFVHGRKKSMISYYLKLGQVHDEELSITVTDDSNSAIAIQMIDNHILDADAHSRPATITDDTTNDTLDGYHTHAIEHATNDKRGIIIKASVEVAQAGIDDDSAVTPKGLKAVIDALPSVATATVNDLGVVRLASPQDIQNGAVDKVVTADLLNQAVNSVGYDVDKAFIRIRRGTRDKGDIEFTPPFNCRKIALSGNLLTHRGNIEHDALYTLSGMGFEFTRPVSGSRSGGSGHGYYHNWYVPTDMLLIASSATSGTITVNGQDVFAAGRLLKINIDCDDLNTHFNLDENHEGGYVLVHYYK